MLFFYIWLVLVDKEHQCFDENDDSSICLSGEPTSVFFLALNILAHSHTAADMENPKIMGGVPEVCCANNASVFWCAAEGRSQFIWKIKSVSYDYVQLAVKRLLQVCVKQALYANQFF